MSLASLVSLPSKKFTGRQVEEAILSHLLVDDCAVLVQPTQKIIQETVAYVVSTSQITIAALHTHLDKVLPGVDAIRLVLVAALPLTPQGEIDQQALFDLDAIDADLEQQWEMELRSLPEIDQVAVISQPFTEPLPALHLTDVLSEGHSKSAPAPSPQIEQTVPHLPTGAGNGQNPLAYREGLPLVDMPDMPTILADTLGRTAREVLDNGVLYLQADGTEFFQSYPALLAEAERILAGLRSQGLKPQDKVIFQFSNNQDFIPAFWGCMLGGFVPVPIAIAPSYDSANSVVMKLVNTWNMLERPLVLASQELVKPLQAVAHQLGLEGMQVQAIAPLRHYQPDSNWHAGQPEDLAVLIFTSGSTGTPKGVMLSQQNILSNVAASAQHNEISRDDISLNWLYLDHVGSLVRCCIRDVYVGCQQIHAPADLVLENPLRWLDWIDQYRVTLAWAPNFALGLVNAQAEQLSQRQWDFSCVRSLLSVAEAIVPTTARRFAQLLAPYGLGDGVMHSAWGMSETCAAVVFSHRYLLLMPSKPPPFVKVGHPVPGLKMRIVDASGQVIEEGKTGFLEISGPMIAEGYYQNPDLNQEAFTADGWLKTGDLGFIWEGRLTVTGRLKDVIIINGLNHYSHEIEAVVESVSGVEVSYTAACAVRSPESNTDQLVIFFHPESENQDQLPDLLKEIRGAVTRKLQINPIYLIPVSRETIPKTAIGKIQRSRLKQRFEAGEFEPILKQLDILTGNANTIPDWFYQKIWCRREIVTRSSTPLTGYSLIFLDELGLGQAVCQELDYPSILVVAGNSFTKHDNHYSIDPKQPDHYRKLFQSLQAADQAIAQIFHLWTYSQQNAPISSLTDLQQAQELGVYSLLYLVQALHQKQGSEQPVRLFVVSSSAQATSPQAAIAYQKTPLLGLVKTLPQELPWLDCRHIDLTADQISMDALHVLAEMDGIQKEQEVAYRHGQRLVLRLQKVFPKAEKQALPFKRGGMYLISGGLGDIAVAIAQYLLKHDAAKLLLIGRTPLPDPADWEQHLQQGGKLGDRLRAYQSLQTMGGSVAYAAVDICNLAALEQAVDQAEQVWQCPLDGVLHLAGIGQDRLLLEETPDSFAATLAPKVFGTWVLHQLLQQRSTGVFISLSSVISLQGALTVGAYAAANRFLDGFQHYQSSSTHLRSYCFASSTWAGVGISRGYEYRDSRYAQGREVMTAEQGIHSFLASLHYGPAHIMAGLNGTNPHIRRYQIVTSLQQKLHAYYTVSTGAAKNGRSLASRMAQLQVRDRFGNLSSCRFVPLEAMPLQESGAIDLAQLGMPNSQNCYVAPQTDLEHQLGSIWQTTLGLSKVGIRDNFFELGGSSLLAVELFTHIETSTGKKLPLATLFQAPTIEQLAAVFHQQTQANLWSSLVPIQPAGTKLPLFAIHEVTGQVLFYRDLARHLTPDQPLYGLQPLLRDGEHPCHESIEAMATHYIREMRQLQPQGPYHLMGYSLGGVIAFEIAQQLLQQSQTVALLGMVDNRSLLGFEEFTYIQLKPFRQKLLLHLSKLLTLPWHQKIPYFLKQCRYKLDSPAENYSTMTASELMGTKISEHHSELLERYMPQPYAGSITLFLAKDEPKEADPEFIKYYDAELGWSKLTTQTIDTYEIPGRHFTIVKEPYVQFLAKQVENCLEQIRNQENPVGQSFSKTRKKVFEPDQE